MDQKEIKIVALKVNEQFGILQSFECEFDQNSNLIIIKGEVGSGKSTLQQSLSLGTLGSETLKYDKALYGKIDQEVQLLDGDTPIFVGCKSNDKGKLAYVIYTKDEEGNIAKDPVVDGVKLTPSDYLKSLQTALTWRMEELTSQNPTVQKKLLLELYKTDLVKVGVIFDKADENYSSSILGKIEATESDRTQKDYQRKQVGGFAKHLEPMGIDVDKPDTLPTRQDLTQLETDKNKLTYDLNNIDTEKNQKLEGIKLKVDGVYVKLREANEKITKENNKAESVFKEKQRVYGDSRAWKERIEGDLVALKNNDCLDEDGLQYLLKMVGDTVKLAEPAFCEVKKLVEFDEQGKCTTKELPGNVEVTNLLIELASHKEAYTKVQNQVDETKVAEINKNIEAKELELNLAKENNKRCDAVDAFNGWRDVDQEVAKLKREYAKKLKSVNTGVEGLRIEILEAEGKFDIYLTYNGAYDPDYFGNKDTEYRKVSSYSGTQKPIICLLLQNYLLSKKPKAMRYLWIDNVPIDKKTKVLLDKMGKELNLTIFVNITGDFKKEDLDGGDILIVGGEIFFN